MSRPSRARWGGVLEPACGTHPTGQKAANSWGLYDMNGNVWEWVFDEYGDYPRSPVTDPTGPTGSSARVLRGGSWYDLARYSRAAFRSNRDRGDRYSNIGFRLVRSTP